MKQSFESGVFCLSGKVDCIEGKMITVQEAQDINTLATVMRCEKFKPSRKT